MSQSVRTVPPPLPPRPPLEGVRVSAEEMAYLRHLHAEEKRIAAARQTFTAWLFDRYNLPPDARIEPDGAVKRSEK